METVLFTMPSLSAGAAATKFTVGSLLSTAGTIGSVVGQVSAGKQQASLAKAQAQQYELAAKQEELRGREQADSIRRSLQSSLASQRAIFAARGISLGSGTPVRLAGESTNQASMDIETAMFNAGTQASALRTQAAQTRIEGRSGRVSSYVGAASTLGKYRLIN